MDIEEVDVEFRRAVASHMDRCLGVNCGEGGPMMAASPAPSSSLSTQVVLQYLPIVLQALLDVISKLKQQGS